MSICSVLAEIQANCCRTYCHAGALRLRGPSRGSGTASHMTLLSHTTIFGFVWLHGLLYATWCWYQYMALNPSFCLISRMGSCPGFQDHLTEFDCGRAEVSNLWNEALKCKLHFFPELVDSQYWTRIAGSLTEEPSMQDTAERGMVLYIVIHMSVTCICSTNQPLIEVQISQWL